MAYFLASIFSLSRNIFSTNLCLFSQIIEFLVSFSATHFWIQRLAMNVFRSLYDDYSQKQENKIWCIIHYFKRISSDMPKGFLSFERKVLPFDGNQLQVSYPDTNFWSTSSIPLCRFEVVNKKVIFTILNKL